MQSHCSGQSLGVPQSDAAPGLTGGESPELWRAPPRMGQTPGPLQAWVVSCCVGVGGASKALTEEGALHGRGVGIQGWVGGDLGRWLQLDARKWNTRCAHGQMSARPWSLRAVSLSPTAGVQRAHLTRHWGSREKTYLTSGSTTKPQLPRQYGTGTKTEI